MTLRKQRVVGRFVDSVDQNKMLELEYCELKPFCIEKQNSKKCCYLVLQIEG